MRAGGEEFFGDLDRVVVCHQHPVSVLVDDERVAVCGRAVRRMFDGRWHVSRVHLKMEWPGSVALMGAAVRSAWWSVGISGLDDEQVVESCAGLRDVFRVEDHLDVAEVRVVRHFELDRESLTTIERVLVCPTVRDGLDRLPVSIEDERSSVLSFDPTDRELYDAVLKAASAGS